MPFKVAVAKFFHAVSLMSLRSAIRLNVSALNVKGLLMFASFVMDGASPTLLVFFLASRLLMGR